MTRDLVNIGLTVEPCGFPMEVLPNVEKYPAWTWVDDTQILICAGLVPVWKGLAEAWAAVSPALRQHSGRKEVLAGVRESLVELAHIFRYRRIQTDIKKDFRDGHAFALLLGFRREFDMPDYGPHGETTTRYVWLAKERGCQLRP